MSSSETSPSGATLVGVIVVLGAVTAGIAVVGDLLLSGTEERMAQCLQEGGTCSQSIPTWLAVAVTVAATVTVGVPAWFSYRSARRSSHEFQESRQRIREAEHGLEEALRERVEIHGPVTIHYDGTTARPQPDSSVTGSATDGDVVSQAEAPSLTLSHLWTLTHRRLDHYHDIALRQAKRSFSNAQAAMVVGFLLLFVFALIAWNASTTAGIVVAGGLGTVSAGLAGYVSRTFVRSQETAAGHLKAYFDQPLEFARYLAAERLIADAGLSEEQRAEVLATFVQAMVSPPDPPADPNGVPRPRGV